MALAEIPQYLQEIIPTLYILGPIVIGITLKQAANMKANILVNNLNKKERQALLLEADKAQMALRNAETFNKPITAKMLEEAGFATIVLTKLAAAGRRKDEKASKKTSRGRNYM